MRWVVGVVVGASVLAACGGSDAEPTATPANDATATATEERAATAEATPEASATPTVWDDYVEVVEGEPVPLPEGVVLYYYGYVFTEGIPADRWLRAHQTSEGLVVRDLAPDVPENSNGGYQFLDDAATGHLSARLCVQGYCGGHADPSPDAREETYQSLDGGITWMVVSTPDSATYLAGTLADGTTVAFTYDEATGENTWFTWPDMEGITPPASRANGHMLDGRFAWRLCPDNFPNPGCTLYDESGEVIAEPLQLPASTFDAIRGETLDLAWWIPWPRDSESSVYISEVAADGSLIRTVKAKGFDPRLIGWIDEDRIIVRRWGAFDSGLADTAILNLETGEMNRIEGLQPTEQDRDVYATEVMTGEFAMVHAPGSCLHIRTDATADSESLECFADGVLFEVTGDAVEDDGGTAWLPVRAPGGIEGFASTEFLLR